MVQLSRELPVGIRLFSNVCSNRVGLNSTSQKVVLVVLLCVRFSFVEIALKIFFVANLNYVHLYFQTTVDLGLHFRLRAHVFYPQVDIVLLMQSVSVLLNSSKVQHRFSIVKQIYHSQQHKLFILFGSHYFLEMLETIKTPKKIFIRD